MKVKFLDGHEKEFETLEGADLRGADLRNLNLKGKSLCGADLMNADLKGADLALADLTGANLRGACLRNTYLWNAELRYANLRGAEMEGADLQGADLRGAEFDAGALCQGALLGAILDKEHYARLRDILDKVGKKVDDEGTRAQVMRDMEIHGHYEHAKEKHPVFADVLTHNNNTSAKRYKQLRDEAHANSDCSPLQVFLAEYAEVLEAIAVEDKSQAVYECYDCIAVLLRLIDMIEETAEKEGWLEEVRR